MQFPIYASVLQDKDIDDLCQDWDLTQEQREYLRNNAGHLADMISNRFCYEFNGVLKEKAEILLDEMTEKAEVTQ